MSTKGLPLDVGVRQELEHQTDFGPNHAKFVEDVWDFCDVLPYLPPAPITKHAAFSWYLLAIFLNNPYPTNQ